METVALIHTTLSPSRPLSRKRARGSFFVPFLQSCRHFSNRQIAAGSRIDVIGHRPL